MNNFCAQFNCKEKIQISHHCMTRFYQRYRRKFPNHYFRNSQFTRSLINELVIHSYEDTLTKSSPFYKNKMRTTHNNSIILHQPNHGIFFAIVKDKSRIVVKSCFDNFDPRFTKI